MATAYTTSLKLALPTQGELTGIWGDTLNNQVTSMIEEAVAGLKTIDTWSTNSATLSTANGSTSESRAAILNLTDTTSDLSGAATLICPAASKVYIVKNATGQAVTVKTASGTGIAIPNGTTGFVYCDGTNVLEALTNVTGNLVVGGNTSIGGNLTVTGTTTFNGGTLTLGDANTDNIVFGGEVDSNIIPDDDNTYDLGSSSKEWKDIYINGTAYLDAINFNGTAISATAAELNILDGDTSATSTTVADADRVVLNDAGTMKQVAVTDLSAYFDDEITAMPNLITTAATTVGALNSGSITSGFGNIDIGSSTITTTGLITGGSLDIDDVLINGTTIGHTDDTDLITLANGLVTVAGEVSMTTLDIGGTNVTSTPAELNLLDGSAKSTSSITIADADAFIVIDGTTTKQIPASDIKTYALGDVTAVGALNSGSITSGFGNIDNGSSTANFGATTVDSLDVSDGNITNVGNIALDSISADDTDINVAVSDNSATAFTIKQGSDNYLVIDTANSSESVSIGTGISGTAISIGHGTSETTINDNLTVTGDLTVNGATTTVDTANTTVKDNLLELNSGASSNSNDSGIIIQRGSTGNDALFMWDESEDKFALGTTTDNASSTGNLNMTTGTLVANIEGNVTGNVTGNTSGTAATVTGAAQSNITSLGTLTTLTVDNVIVNGTTIGHTDDTDLITLADGVVTVAGEVSMTTLDIGGTNVGSTAAELNLLDGSAKSTSSITIADSDGFIVIDGTTTKQIPASDIKTYAAGSSATKGFATAMAIAL